jgi:RNase P subunit RPR2
MTLCALCRRNLLAGESFRYWQSAEERQVTRVVCHLCEPVATRDGWSRTERHERENAVGLRGTVRLVA